MNLLLLEDDRGVRETVATAFKSLGWDVAEAATCADGIRSAERQRFDAGLLDLRLPDASGLEALACFRRTQSIGSAAYLMTGFASPYAQGAAEALGATGFLHKPFDLDDLVSLFSLRPGAAAEGSVVVHPTETTETFAAPALRRWVDLMQRGAAADSDLRTLADWCTAAGVSRSVLEGRCRAANLSAKASLDLLRLLKARLDAKRHSCAVTWFLDGDPRTVRRLLKVAGPLSDPTLTWRDWLDRQHLIENGTAIRALKAALTSRGPA